jgi:energy-coupling factor transporter transmembrane protein EcfT
MRTDSEVGKMTTIGKLVSAATTVVIVAGGTGALAATARGFDPVHHQNTAGSRIADK